MALVRVVPFGPGEQPQFPEGGYNWGHEALIFKLIKVSEIVITQFGINSLYTYSILKGVADNERCILYDWKLTARMCLSPSEFFSFKPGGKRRQNNKNCVTTELILQLISAQLMGTGPWLALRAQLAYSYEDILQVHFCCL